eukprot:TRINITY_DN3479_c0_g2_i1.p1 TRINITY_DN3479_c0_g2~~TRINITY_DN3479_c0_g2_i1.p1  ORF type:complete len:173 (-),score=45.24 TRINITY_DN3479_c0_g2_i1:234-752(-)
MDFDYRMHRGLFLPRPMRVVTESERKEIRTAFHAYAKSDKISRRHLKLAALCCIGMKPSKVELDFLAPKDENGVSDGVDWSTFEAFMIQKLSLRDDDEIIRQAFLSFDRAQKGFLQFDDIVYGLKEMLKGISDQVVMDVFQELDRDRDGRVSYRDFELIMKLLRSEKVTIAS